MTTKIHLLADVLGRPLRFLLTAGQVHEITQAESLLEEAEGGAVLVDKGYDCNALRQSIVAKGMTPVIPTLRSRKVQIPYDKEAYKLRNAHRTLLLPPQVLPSHRHSLRPKGLSLPRLPPPHRFLPMVQLNVDWP